MVKGELDLAGIHVAGGGYILAFAEQVLGQFKILHNLRTVVDEGFDIADDGVVGFVGKLLDAQQCKRAIAAAFLKVGEAAIGVPLQDEADADGRILVVFIPIAVKEANFLCNEFFYGITGGGQHDSARGGDEDAHGIRAAQAYLAVLIDGGFSCAVKEYAAGVFIGEVEGEDVVGVDGENPVAFVDVLHLLESDTFASAAELSQ